MSQALNDVHETLLMGPGPSCVPASVYEAIRRPTIGHFDPSFIRIMDELQEMLRSLLKTSNRLTLPMSGTGSAGMETCFVNLVEPGDRVLVLSNGVFGQRMQDVAGRLGAEVEALSFDWGKPVEVEVVREKLRGPCYDIIAIVHAETSTGVGNPVAEVGALVRENGALYLVDTVTSLGGMPVEVDAWGADAVYSGTQKCLSCPPGLAPVSFSARAEEKLVARATKVPNWYLDLSLLSQYWSGGKRVYHHTAPVNMLYALHQAAACILDEGLDAVFARHRSSHEYLVQSLSDLGLNLLVEPAYRLPMLNAVIIPDGVDEASVRARLLDEFQIEIGAGLGPLAGKVWRIGLMGHTARREHVDRLCSALSEVL